MPSFAMGRELAGLGGLFKRFVAAPLTGAVLFNQGRSGSVLDQGLQSIPSTRKTDAGRALGNVLGNEMRYMGSQLQRGSLPYLGNEMRYTTNELLQGRNPYGRPLNGIQTGKYGPTDWNPSANPLASVTSNDAADRAYQQEKARVTQMTEQDPMFKKYKVAELTKAYNTASPEEKNKIGLQIWATTNPELAAKLKPGQTGYQEAYDLLGTQTFGTGQPVSTKVNFEQSTEKAGAPTPELPTGFAQAYTNPVPNFGMGINMQQTAYAPEGQSAPEMVSPDFSNVPLMSPPKELVDLMKNRAFKQAFESRIK
jgi:hypothetical protein